MSDLKVDDMVVCIDEPWDDYSPVWKMRVPNRPKFGQLLTIRQVVTTKRRGNTSYVFKELRNTFNPNWLHPGNDTGEGVFMPEYFRPATDEEIKLHENDVEMKLFAEG